MKLENLVCSLEQGKRLKELGVEQDSMFYYIEYLPKEEGGTGGHYIEYRTQVAKYIEEKISAWTSGELRIALGEEEKYKGLLAGKTEEDNRANHLIYLLDNKLVNVAEVNERLLK